MLYLIKEFGKENVYLKIGYTQNLEERLKAYNTHSAEFELIDSMEGDQDLESFSHKLLISYNIKGEWFKEDPMVYYVWELTKQEYEIRQQEKTIKELEASVKELKELLNIYKDKYKELKENLEI